MSIPTVNFIDADVQRDKTAAEKFDWSLEASQKLAKAIQAKVVQGKINIRIVVQGDNLGRIVEGLSCGAVKLKEEGGHGWENIPVVYLGPSPRIQEQKEKNLDSTLMKASLIHPGQYVAFRNNCVYIGDTVEQITER
ncbi:MAG: hypothetical protein JSS10_09595 [Verrucomicrobia bacterium]|nr:hypothetical protein [Verrucomicrobiota bacterium]